MDKYTPQEQAEIVKIFFENNRSIIATQWELCQKYPNRPVPHKTTVYRLHANFRQYGRTTTGLVQSLQKCQLGDVVPSYKFLHVV
ncbi:hypothetical protein GWI33_001476 [Rhynchophorus ferrugineus]|uniref:DUF4817 domain-containing protein n=1 Tax=Rhynchophorus ferrugineus TaxID=354439 RepID=A0A834IQ99_RHYFE|nr:hypothetical protein GWI33_001476 [Rhynchophorus ferrugineus]